MAFAIFFLLKIGLFLLGSRPVFLVLLVFVDEVARGYDFEASQDDHVEGLIRVELCPGRGQTEGDDVFVGRWENRSRTVRGDSCGV